METNPIFRQELWLSSRSGKIPLLLLGYNLLLALIAVLAIAIANSVLYDISYDYSALSMLFPLLVCVQIVVVTLVAAVITGGSISDEREKQTLDVILTTPMTPFSIAAGKLGSVIVKLMMFIISGLPTLSVAFILGGLSWLALLEFVGLMVILSIYAGSIGIFCSSMTKKSAQATRQTIIIIILLYVITAFGSLDEKNALLFLFFNPLSMFAGFLLRTLDSTGLLGYFAGYEIIMPDSVIRLSRIASELGIIANMSIAAFFIWLSTFSIGAVRKT